MENNLALVCLVRDTNAQLQCRKESSQRSPKYRRFNSKPNVYILRGWKETRNKFLLFITVISSSAFYNIFTLLFLFYVTTRPPSTSCSYEHTTPRFSPIELGIIFSSCSTSHQKQLAIKIRHVTRSSTSHSLCFFLPFFLSISFQAAVASVVEYNQA